MDEREQRIEEILLIIGGAETAIFRAKKLEHWDFAEKTETLSAKYYEKLRRLANGLPEEPVKPSETA